MTLASKVMWFHVSHIGRSSNVPDQVKTMKMYFPSPSLENHITQLTRDYQQECNILSDWIERFTIETTDPTNLIPRRLRRKIKPTERDLTMRLKSWTLSPLLPETTNLERFREEFWRGGLFGVKVFKEREKENFLKEVKVLDAIGTHPHIVYSFGVSEPEGKDGYKYWMEKMDGDLYNFITEFRRSHGDAPEDLPFSVTDSMAILLQIAKAMTHLHELKVIHGDLKPDNILISHYEVLGDIKIYIVKVADFDRAEIIKSDDEVVYITGTDDYIAPEVQKARDSQVSESNEESKTRPTPLSGSTAKKCDVYSFGIVAVEVLSGQISDQISNGKPKDSDHDDKMAPLKAIGIYHKYPGLIDLVDRCLNHDSSLRLSFADVTSKLEYIIKDVFN